VGQLVAALKAKDMWDNTLLVYCSDKYVSNVWGNVQELYC